ncbi:MAG: peptidase [Bacteroidales bacterium]|nr:MAG: peptidase [Bacteroidales bacterium]
MVVMMKLIIKVHRLLGTLLSIMFLLWFLSGFVMIYKHFPKIGNKAYQHQVALPDTMPNIEVLRSVIPQGEPITSISVESFRQRPIFRVETEEGLYVMQTDSALTPIYDESVPYREIELYAKRWTDAQIEAVDTLYSLDQWIPSIRYKRDMPIYKFRFADQDRTYLYVSSLTGQAIQSVSRTQRFWAWCGPIPHFLYFWQLRQDTTLWRTVLLSIAWVGTFMCLAGIIVGIRGYWIVYRRKRQFKTPYKKTYYKWHHIIGFLFGFFVMMFVFSGVMSFSSMPDWVVAVHDKTISKKISMPHTPKEPTTFTENDGIALSMFELDYRKLLQEYRGDVKEIRFQRFGDKPYYEAIIGGEIKHFDASVDSVKPLYLTEQEVLARIDEVTNAPKTISLMTEYDNYHIGFTKRVKLPVYKVVLDDADGSVFYVCPKTCETRYYNNNKRAKKWIYPAFHSLRIKFFVEHPILRQCVMWILLLGGTVVSVTGIVLGVGYATRLFRHKRNKR